MPGHCLMAQAGNESKPVTDTLIPVIALAESDFDNGDLQQFSSLLTAGRDPFTAAASFNFSPVRFKMRGYDADLFSTTLNGLPMNSLDNGYTPWAMWSGLTDVMRNREQFNGLRAASAAFGGPGGTLQIDARAGRQRRQTAVTYGLSNRSYVHRFNAMHATGYTTNGWAFAVAASMRLASEGYVPGTFYNGKSYYISADKKLGKKQVMSIVLLGAYTQAGRQAASVQEAKEAAGSLYYNPSWGYQEGRKRNANVATTHQPLLLLTHDYQFGQYTSLITAAGCSFGSRGTTALDWYNAADPRPDYYRYLPDYQSSVALQQQVKQAWATDAGISQINWAQLYAVNSNGIDGRSRYILEDRMIYTTRSMAAATFTTRMAQRICITTGISFQFQQNHYYKTVHDLLGGAFYVDVNQFAERDFPGDRNAIQNDLNHPDRKLMAGDRFGYNYIIAVQQQSGWLQLAFTSRKLELFVAASRSRTAFRRTGRVRNGLFPLNSYGPSEAYAYAGYGLKAGVTYKLNGRHYLYLHGAAVAKAPYFDDVYISPRTRDMVQDQATTEKITTTEGGYVWNAPAVKLRAGGYLTSFRDGMNVLSFYHDTYNSFVNYALRNINRLHYGSEIGIEVKIVPDLTMNAAAAMGRYYYTGRQQAVVTLDNNASVIDKATVYAQHFRIGGTPQEAYSAGISYRSPAAWFMTVTGNYFTQQWLGINPLRHTPQAVDNLDPQSVLYQEIIGQTKWPSQYTVDLFAGYNRKLPARWLKNTSLVIYAGINNLLNNRGMISGGYEQLRFDAQEKQVSRFPPKAWYAYGINCFLSIALRF
jgi:hypothetical protein